MAAEEFVENWLASESRPKAEEHTIIEKSPYWRLEDNFDPTLNSKWYSIVCGLIYNKLGYAQRFGKKGKIRVLDFGGDQGIHYHHIKHTLITVPGLSFCKIFSPYRHDNGVEWNIVETQDCIDVVIRRNKNGDPTPPEIQWFSDINELEGEMDFIYSDGALHYMEDYNKTLSEMMSFKPQYIFLHKSTIGQHNTCLAMQTNFPDYGIIRNGRPSHFWFINEESFREYIELHGYKVYHKEYFGNHPKYEIVEGSLGTKNDYCGQERADCNNFILEREDKCFEDIFYK